MKLLSYLFLLITTIRNFLYDKNILKSKKIDDLYIVCIGNVTVGGTGKTPTVQYLTNKFIEQNKKVAVVLRGYKGKRDIDPLIVSDGEKIFVTEKESGDEAYLHAKNLSVPVVVGKDRYKACKLAKDIFDVDTIILDDGFQHRKLFRDKDLLVIDASNPFGNGYLLPYGNLRESLKNIDRADEIIITKSEQVSKEKLDKIINELKKYKKKITISAYKNLYFYNKNKDKEELNIIKNKKIFVFSGLGNPEPFYNSLKKLNPIDIKIKTFPDHYSLTKEEYDDILKVAKDFDYIITTEKDFIKLDLDKTPDNLLVLKIDFTILEDNLCV
ncbi:lipid-A-disaccharide kinase [Hypnocyclicus thermotrophus]|uniref:Tetraacyldisaccharide 4'-kinase n=1 Tax=Hypnocyclicus thermotrophus TaxID=1627895 RepID=A0AA46DZK0_9FUSO|nr:tetraacyldisaccharide 4'-kinase [Hypnocyclicus thermotrophus]TDT71888.1 lipid-A-disaccharide kinase [Hypnocyclicus thermotrophus]